MAVEEERKGPRPANANGSRSGQSLDPRILRIAEAITRQLAREQAKLPAAANDNEPRPSQGQLLQPQFHLLGSLAQMTVRLPMQMGTEGVWADASENMHLDGGGNC
jgi:hypothetical protein